MLLSKSNTQETTNTLVIFTARFEISFLGRNLNPPPQLEAGIDWDTPTEHVLIDPLIYVDLSASFTWKRDHGKTRWCFAIVGAAFRAAVEVSDVQFPSG
jgi:hypothetical protein